MIICSLHGAFLAVLQHELLTTGSRRTAQIKVIFDEEWRTENTQLFAVFSKDGETLRVQIPSDHTVMIPAEVLRNPGFFDFSVFVQDAAGSIVKTSRTIHYQVHPGADPGAAAWIDWDAFKADLIAALNDRFALDLAADADNDTILAAIANLQNGAEVRAWWIDFIGRALQTTSLSPDDSDEDIMMFVESEIEILLDSGRDLRRLIDGLSDLIYDHTGVNDPIVSPDFATPLRTLDNYMTSLEDDRQTLITALSNLYIGG